MRIQIITIESSPFVLSEDGVFGCQHLNAYVDPACCSGRDSEGNPSCDCNGMDAVICPDLDCSGLQDREAQEILSRLSGGDDE